MQSQRASTRARNRAAIVGIGIVQPWQLVRVLAILRGISAFVMPIAEGFNLLALLAMGHFVADFALQNDRMAVEKCPGKGVVLPWQWWLGSHAAIHGFLVAVLTGVPMLGLAEWVVHALIDLAKCRKAYGLKFDQALHLLTKVLWAALAVTCFA